MRKIMQRSHDKHSPWYRYAHITRPYSILQFSNPLSIVLIESSIILFFMTYYSQLWSAKYCMTLNETNQWLRANDIVITRALRAHTPRAPCNWLSCNLDICCRRPLPMHVRGPVVRMSRNYMHKYIVGNVDGCGYDGKIKYTICDACRPYHSIFNILKPVFRQIRQIRCIFESLRCLDVEIWGFSWWRLADRQTDYFTLAHARGIITH